MSLEQLFQPRMQPKTEQTEPFDEYFEHIVSQSLNDPLVENK